MSVFKWVKGLFRKEQPVNDSVKWDIVDGYMPGTFMVRRTQYGVCEYLQICGLGLENQVSRIMDYCVFESRDDARLVLGSYIRKMMEEKSKEDVSNNHYDYICSLGTLSNADE